MTDEAPHTPTPETPTAAPDPVVADVQPAPTAPVVEAKAEKTEPARDFAAQLAEFQAKAEKLEAELAKQRAETTALAFTAAFDRAGVAPAYRDYLRGQLGDIDPRSDAGLAAIDAAAKKHPAMLIAHVSTEDPIVAFARQRADEARKAGQQSMWSVIPPSAIQGYDVKGGAQ